MEHQNKIREKTLHLLETLFLTVFFSSTSTNYMAPLSTTWSTNLSKTEKIRLYLNLYHMQYIATGVILLHLAAGAAFSANSEG